LLYAEPRSCDSIFRIDLAAGLAHQHFSTMEPITTTAVILFVADKLGDHYIEKFLDSVDRGFKAAFDRFRQTGDSHKVTEYLEKNPSVAREVEKGLDLMRIRGVVLPPEGSQLVPADRLIVFAG